MDGLITVKNSWVLIYTESPGALRALRLQVITILLEITHAGSEDPKILLAVNINRDVVSASFRMAHLAQHSSVRARNTFNRPIRAVDIPLFIH